MMTMPENKIIPSCPTGDDQPKKDHATSQALALFDGPEEAIEIFHENKMTNTEGVNKGIYFSYPSRRHSCASVNIPTPCVNKMISHIQGVESKIQEHLKRFETSFEEWSIISSTKDLKEGIDLQVKEVKIQEVGDEKCPELKQEMETLLSEAIHLIKSLETDRAEAEEALKQQRLRRKKVNMKIDSWSIWRLEELPAAVQKEHEAHLKDIIELRWYLEDNVQQLKQIEEQKTEIEEVNAKIEADIDYMNQYEPLLKLKKKQELNALREHFKKKYEVMELYKQVHGELEEAIENYKNVRVKAKELKEDMDKDIKIDETSIEMFKKEIEKIKNTYIHYCSSINDVNDTIEENKEAVTVALNKTQSTTNEVSSLSRMLDDLKKSYDQVTWKKKAFEKNYLEELNNFYATKSTWETELTNVAKDLSDLKVAYAQLMEENRKFRKDTEILSGHINESINKKAQHEAEILSLNKLRTKNNEYLKQLYRDAYHLGAIFHLTKFKADEMEDKIAEVRRKYKGREDFLKKLTRREVANLIMIQKRLYAIQEKQAQERQELAEKKAIYTLALSEIETPMLQLEEDAIRIRTAHELHFKTLNDMLKKKEIIRRHVEKTKRKLQEREKKTQDVLVETEVKRSIIFKEIEDTKNKTNILQDKISQLDQELESKEEEKKSLDQILETLKEKFITVRYKKEHAQAVFDHYKSEKKACEERLYEEQQRFRVLHNMRQKTLVEIKKTHEDSLKENLRLAQEYQKTQDDFLTEKDNYFNMYDRQLSLEASLRDKKQLCQLQRRVHKVWQKHFQLVALYSQMRLAKFQTDSQESIQKILAVQEESSNLIQHILSFFQSLTDGSCENDG
ncbi:coiled-coil domain-containing protein 178 [Dasypus novemcinctus]|uniref:coiled-coil domain-containing protein 178 n=1 Tax=Dasypus novemcinctus TaxID=9361 RepID=UPI00265E0D2E|nr:coiled-coil domain-containing protein 178 [Dasypus novemcinctus]